MRSKDNIIEILDRWGNWASYRLDTGWYTEMPGLKNVLPVYRSMQIKLTDSDGMIIDRALAKAHCAEESIVSNDATTFVILKHKFKFNQCEAAEYCRVSETKVRRDLTSLYSYLSGKLEDVRLDFDRLPDTLDCSTAR